MNKTEVIEEKLLSIAGVAELFSFSITHTKRSIITQDGFPKPVRITDNGTPRWKYSEILLFIEERKEI